MLNRLYSSKTCSIDKPRGTMRYQCQQLGHSSHLNWRVYGWHTLVQVRAAVIERQSTIRRFQQSRRISSSISGFSRFVDQSLYTLIKQEGLPASFFGGDPLTH